MLFIVTSILIEGVPGKKPSVTSDKHFQHPLRGLLPKKKVSTYNLRNQTSQYPKVNTDRFKNSYVNRLIFKYNLAM